MALGFHQYCEADDDAMRSPLKQELHLCLLTSKRHAVLDAFNDANNTALYLQVVKLELSGVLIQGTPWFIYCRPMNASEHCVDSFIATRKVAGHLLFVLSPPATVLNLLVLVAAWRLLRQYQEPIHAFILGMTIADLVITAFTLPMEAMHFAGIINMQQRFDIQFCHLHQALNILSQTASSLHLIMLNVDKLIYFRQPLHYERLVTPTRVWSACGLVWILCTVYVTALFAPSHALGFLGPKANRSIADIHNVSWYERAPVEHRQCLRVHIHAPYYHIHFMFIGVLPLISCAILSAYLYELTRRFRKIAVETCATQEHTWRLRALLFIFSTTIWTLLCFVPYRLFNLARFVLEGHHFGGFCGLMHQAYYYTSWASLFLLMLNPIGNPLITILIYAVYKRQTKNILLSLLPKQWRIKSLEQHDTLRSVLSQRGNATSGSDLSLKRDNGYHLVMSARNTQMLAKDRQRTIDASIEIDLDSHVSTPRALQSERLLDTAL